MPIFVAHQTGASDDQFDNGSPCSAEVGASLAGRVNWLIAMAQGVNGAAINPQGQPGIDHSGAPYGVHFKTTVALFGGEPQNANFQGGFLHPTSGTTSALPLIDDQPFTTGNRRFWMKPHVPGSPLGTLQGVVRVKPAAASTFTVTMIINGATVTYTSSSISVETSITFSSAIPVISGWNAFSLSIQASAAGDHEVTQIALEVAS